MDTVTWALALKDKTTPAGKKIASTFDAIGKRAQKLGEGGLKLATAGLIKLGQKTSEVVPKIAKWAALATLAAGVGLAYAGTKLATDAQRFKDSTLLATRALLKSDALAGSAYKRMLDFANYFGQDPAEAIARFNKALADGFSARDAEKLLQAFGDLKLVTPNVNADALTDAFGEIRKKGKLELGDFQSAVSAAGLNLTLAYEAIGKKIGKNAKEVETLIGSGQVNAQVGLVGLLDAINQRTNSKQVGDRLTEYANTASGLVDRLKGLPQQFMLRMTADDSPIKGTLKKLLEQLDPEGPNGKKIMGALDAAFTQIGTILSTWATPEGIEKLSKTIADVVEAAPKIMEALGVVADVVITVVDAFASFRDNCRFLWAELKRGDVVVTTLGVAVTSIAAPLVSTGLAMWRWANIAIDGIKTIWAWLSDLGTKALTWGSDIAAGLWKGLKAAWTWLVKKISGLIDLLPDAAKKVLGIASPSKVFAELGVYTMQGFQAGVVKAAPAANDSIVAAIESGAQSASGAVNNISTASSVSSSRSSKVVTVNVGGINVETDAKDGRSMGRDIAREIERSFDWAAIA